MKKVLTVIGARPQFIKAAVVSRSLRERGIQEVLVHTGQHYDPGMSDIFFEQLDIKRPAHYLGVGSGSHGAMTGRQLEKIEEVLMVENPDWVLVYGDTNSTLAGALAAAKLHIPIAHVESGLRSFNRKMPEEINRVVTDHLSSLLFAPTLVAVRNLEREGIDSQRVLFSGDVMLDATLFYQSRARRPEWFEALGLVENQFILCTIHRAENTTSAETLRGIMEGLMRSDYPIILPLHPRTRHVIEDALISIPDNILAVPPVGYLEMTWLEMSCRMIATDSGGVQKEAYFHGKPCITLRNETEWLELIESGWNKLVGVEPSSISAGLKTHRTPSDHPDLYGNGKASELIVKALLDRDGV